MDGGEAGLNCFRHGHPFTREGRGFALRAAVFGGTTAATGRANFGLYQRFSQALSPSRPGISTRSVMFI